MEVTKSSVDQNIIQILPDNFSDSDHLTDVTSAENAEHSSHDSSGSSTHNIKVSFDNSDNIPSSQITTTMLYSKLNLIATELESFKEVISAEYKTINELIAGLNRKDKRKEPKKSIIKRLLHLFAEPKIGVLHHYNPKMLKIPARYKRRQKIRTPLITIVTPSYNQANFIESTINSVLCQKYPSLEYIIQDGGSTDHTVEIIEKYKDSLKYWESKKDGGQTQAINLGFKHATGEIMAYLNSDDILLPGTLSYVAQYLEEHPDIDVVYGHRILIDENDYEIGRWVLPQHDNHVLSWADYIPQESLFWRKRIWDKIGGSLDENFRFAMDWDMLLRFKDAGAKFVRLPRFLGAFRIHANQKTTAEMSKIGEEEINQLRVRCHGRLVSHQEISANVRFYKLKHIIYHNLYKLGLLRY